MENISKIVKKIIEKPEKALFDLVGAVVFVLLLEAIVDFGFDTGKGMQIGYISEIHETGVFWKPTEVRLLNIITTMSKQDTSWDYGIEPELKEIALKYQKENIPVKVSYEVRPYAERWKYPNRVVIVEIEPLELNKTD